jgi:hypothetical protein
MPRRLWDEACWELKPVTERDRVFATHIYSVNQSNGTPSNDSLTLDTNYW